MIRLLLCLSFGIVFASGSPTGDIQCPRLPCPLPPCDDPHPTYYHYHGKLCQGCSQCDLTQDVTCPFLPCPFLPCPETDQYSTYYPYHGKLCHGCSQCLPAPTTTATTTPGREPSTRQLIPMGCPIVDCADPNPGSCPVDLITSTFSFHGRDCPGCPVCPVL